MSTIELFPTPSQAPSIHAPSRLPGANDASTKALLHVLKDNHEKWHIFFNTVSRFHNHVAHHVLAIWALGANKDLIEAAYSFDIPFQKPVIEPPEPQRMTDLNFKYHLGDDCYHISYVNFYEQKIAEKGISHVLEEFVFSGGANTTDGAAQEKQPVMLARFFAMLMHPLLHIGNGLEFGLPGMVIEGLALAAVHHGSDAHLLPASLFEELDVLSAKLETTLVLDNPSSTKYQNKAKDVHAFDIIARIIKDEEFSSLPDPDVFKAIKDLKHTATIVAYANQWTLDIEGPEDVRRKIEELQWMNSLIYAVSGFNAKEKEFFADFYLMHLVTSSLFLPSFVAYLKPVSQKVLLRGYLTISLAWFIVRRPRSFNLDVTKFFEADLATQAHPCLSFNSPTWALVHGSSSANPWLPIIQDAIMHADDHVCKLQRAFVYFSEIYGMRGAGGFVGTELKGAGVIDGSLFLRAAALTAKSTGRDFKEGEFQVWDR